MLLPKKNKLISSRLTTIRMMTVLAALTISISAYSASPLNQQFIEPMSVQSAERFSRVGEKTILIKGLLSQKVSQYLGAKHTLTFRDITPDYVAEEMKHLQQTFQGKDVEDAIIAVRFDSHGSIARIYGTAYEDLGLDLSVLTRTTETQSSSVAMVDSKRVAENYLSTLSDIGAWEINQWSEKSTIRVIDGHAHHVLRLNFYAQNTEARKFTRPQLFIHPMSGELLESQELLRRSVQAGSGTGGNEMTGEHTYHWVNHAQDALSTDTFLVDRTGSNCTMKIEPSNGFWKNNVTVMTGENATDAYRYRCDEQGFNLDGSLYKNGAFSPVNDASYNAQVAFNLYENFSITEEKGPLKEVGLPLVVKANYGDSDNAFWNGQFIALGDGARYFYPKVTADTIGHELGHAFLDKYSFINQSAGISMGVAESFADIAGEATEYAIRQRTSAENDWKYGAETFKPTLDEAARYFKQPSIDGRSIDSAKDWNYEVSGHYLAGPMNKAFYHLVHDNADWNPIIGYDLWMTAAANCWVPSTLYEGAAQCIVDMANRFRSNNTSLPSSWSVNDIRYAVIRAFAKVDVMTYTTNDIVALFDYERAFSGIKLVNKTSSQSWVYPDYDWDVGNDGSVEFQTDRLSDEVTVTPEINAENITVKLTAINNSTQDSYLRVLDLASEYCVPSGFGGSSDYVKQVGINGNSYLQSQTQAGGYADHTQQTPLAVKVNGTNSFKLTPNDNDFGRTWVIFIDLNGDHDFDDEGEKLGRKSAKGETTLSATLGNVSASAYEKVTRMRVVVDWAGIERPCAYASSGEYEDYSVLLTNKGVDPEPDPDPVLAFTASSSIGSTRVGFENKSTDVPAESAWSWGYKIEGSTTFTEISTDENTSYDFLSFGRYVVSLTLTLKEGDEFRSEQLVVLEDIDPEQPVYCAAGSKYSNSYVDKFGIRSGSSSFNVLYSNSGQPSDADGYTFFDLSKNKGPITLNTRSWIYINTVGNDNYVQIWIDKGRDGSFDTEDSIFNGRVSSFKWTSFTLDSDMPIEQPYRLRVFLKSGSLPSACEVIDDESINGEVEDYTVFVK